MIVDALVRAALQAGRGRLDCDLAVLAAQRRSDVATWRRPANATDPHWPEPWASEREGVESHWLDDDEAAAGDRVGFDAAGRPVIREVAWENESEPRVDEVWLYAEEGKTDRVTPEGAFRLLFEDRRLVAVVGVDLDELQVERWTWEGGLPLRCGTVRVWEDESTSVAEVAEVDADGRLVRLLSKSRVAFGVPASSFPSALRSTTGFTGVSRGYATAMSSFRRFQRPSSGEWPPRWRRRGSRTHSWSTSG